MEPTQEPLRRKERAASAGDCGYVLLVDDHDLTREVYANLLRMFGYHVVEANSARGALERCRVLRPDIVLLDIRLPDLSGWETARRLRTDPATSSCALLAFSASIDSAGDLHAGDDDGVFDGFVRKPVPPAELARSIEGALDARRRQREKSADGAAA
jgi:CheY-like chemotaxis protein